MKAWQWAVRNVRRVVLIHTVGGGKRLFTTLCYCGGVCMTAGVRKLRPNPTHPPTNPLPPDTRQFLPIKVNCVTRLRNRQQLVCISAVRGVTLTYWLKLPPEGGRERGSIPTANPLTLSLPTPPTPPANKPITPSSQYTHTYRHRETTEHLGPCTIT